MAFTHILLYYCKGILWWLLQLHTNFQFTTLNSWCITEYRVILTPVGFCLIFMIFSWFLLNHKKTLLRWLLHLYAKLQPVVYPVSDRSLTFLCEKSSHSNQNWYRDVFHWALYVYQVSAWSEYVFAFYSKCAKRRRRAKKIKKLKWNFAHSYLGIGWCNLLQIWYVFRFFYTGSISAANLVEFW